jgi:alkanesulfonate monooxygenase
METLTLIPIEDTIVFPGMSATLAIDVGDSERVFLVPRSDEHFASVGTVARVAERLRWVASHRDAAADLGRAANDLRIFGLVTVVVGASDEEARRKLAEYQSYASREGALALMSGWSGVDMSRYGLDERVDDASTQAIQSAMRMIGSRTVGELAEFLAVGGAAPVLAGSPATIADELERWVDETGLDGANLAYTVLPECFDEFVALVVPELQRRGRYKTAYREGTLREKLFGRGARLEPPHPSAKARRPVSSSR